MRYPAGHKEQTRNRIVAAAARVFRRDGIAGASVGQIMGEAGLTVGGFYAHFESKEELLAEALSTAFSQAAEDRTAGLDADPDIWVDGFIARYLSEDHRHQIEDGCPMAALTGEISRSDGPVKECFQFRLQEFVELLAERLGQTGDNPTDTALALTALCVGGLSLARATTDDQLAARLLGACRAAAQTLHEVRPSSHARSGAQSP